MTDLNEHKPVPVGGNIHKILTKYDRPSCGEFITHVDRSSKKRKIKSFLSYAAVQVIFAAVILWRIFRGSSRYLPIVLPGSELFGLLDKPGAEPIELSFSGIAWSSINILIDVTISQTLWPPLKGFVTGALWLRLRYGFRDAEVIFRAPKGYKVSTLRKLPADQAAKVYQTVLFEAIDRTVVNGKVGDMSGNSIWALDVGPMIELWGLIDKGVADVQESAWETSVWMRQPDNTWKVWEVWRVHQATAHDSPDNQIVFKTYRAKLKERGLEDVYARWAKWVQDRIKAGGLHTMTPEEENGLRQIFTNHGLNYDDFYKEVLTDISEGRAEAIIASQGIQ